MTAKQQPQGQQGGQAQASQQHLEQALQAHCQAHGLNLSGLNWAAIVAALTQLIQAFGQGGGAQAQGGQQPQATP